MLFGKRKAGEARGLILDKTGLNDAALWSGLAAAGGGTTGLVAANILDDNDSKLSPEAQERVANALANTQIQEAVAAQKAKDLAYLDEYHRRDGMPFMNETPEDRAVLTQLQRLLVGGDISSAYVTHLIETGQVNDRVALILGDMYDRGADINIDGSPELYQVLEQIKQESYQ